MKPTTKGIFKFSTHKQGYFIIYGFDEGQLESGSFPLFNAFCMARPKSGDIVILKRTGKDKETKWIIGKVTKTVGHLEEDVPEVDFNSPEFSGDTEAEKPPF